MSVVIETTLGDITVDLYLEQRPATCLNFLKLCKMKYYNFNLFHTIRSGFIAQTGDPSGEGSGGQSIWGLLEGASKRFFSGEKMPKIRHTDAGLLSMVCTDDMMVGSQFFFTLAPDLDSLDGVHCVIGEVTEGHEVLTKLNEVICDETHRPYQDVRITHTVILEDPFNDLPGLRAPSRSPSPNAERLRGGRIAPDEEIDETQGKSHEEIQEMIEEKEAKARATILEIVGDLPDADIAPPENVLFVCKLNPVTTDDDLEIIFSRFGKIVSCEVIRDKKTGDSLQYAFIEFDDKKSCEDAYFKMDNVLIDDRRIHVDFSQSVSKMRWLGKGRGVQYYNENDSKHPDIQKSKSKRSHSRERNDSRRQNYKDQEIRDRDNRNRTYRNDKRNNDLRRDRSRSRSRRDSSQNRYIRNDRNHSNENLSRESRTEKSSKNHRESNSNRHENHQRHDSDDRHRKSRTKLSPDRSDRREHIRSPTRKDKDNGEQSRKDRREKTHGRQSSKSHSTHRRERDESNHRVTKHNRDSKEYRKARREGDKYKNKEGQEAEPHTPSPVFEKNNVKSKNDKKQKTKGKNHFRKDKKKRKVSTTSESDTSDSSSSSSSSSSSEEDKKKRRRKRHHSSSSSSSSSSSTSSSSTSSDSSSTSDSECNKKKHRKNENRKPSKKPKKRL